MPEPTKPAKPTITLIHRCCSDGVKLYQEQMKLHPELIGVKVVKINLLNAIEKNLHVKYGFMPSDLQKASFLIINRNGTEEIIKGNN